MQFGTAASPTVGDLRDSRRWLEEVEGTAALDWVKAKNAEALALLGDPKASPMHDRILGILDSKEKIPYVGRVLNGLYYNFWQDATHVRGIWRRTTPAEYKKAEPAWEVVLDLDALSKADGETWVWHGSVVLDEGDDAPTDRVLIRLSRGGADAEIVREFDVNTKAFVPEADKPFVLPEAKSSVCWKDRNTLIVGGAFFGEGSMTDSGYPRTARYWSRGTPLESAVEVFAGEPADVSVGQYFDRDRGHEYEVRYRSLTFYTTSYEAKIGKDGAWTAVPVPLDAMLGTFADQVTIQLRTDWLGFSAGSYLAAPAAAFLASKSDDERKALLTPLFSPSDTCSLEGDTSSKSYIILSVLDNVRSELRFWHYDGKAKAWKLKHTYAGANFSSVHASSVNGDKVDDIWLTSSSYIQPTTYAIGHADAPSKHQPIKALPSMYKADGLVVEQFEATSADGTKVPYFQVSSKGMKLDGSTPTLLYGYGGFEISLTPSYVATVGVGWLESGYVYVQANIRGGGEFGPRWHQAALKEKRNKAYEDFEAVAKDLVARGVTTANRLGIQGGSNGGLLMGNMLARSPELFGAICCQVPLLDMKRFNKLLAGASWMGEYGNPDTADWETFLHQFSPYHTVDARCAVPTLFTTSTRDDRVHPGHARKLLGKMIDLGLPGIGYENIEGGHGGAADNKQRAFMSVIAWSFLHKALTEPKAFSAALAQRTNRDGGRRPVRSTVRAIMEAKGLPWWAAPTIGAVALAALVVRERR